jgi:hypothetical protein
LVYRLLQSSCCVGSVEIEQMLLALALDDLLGSPPVDPPLQRIKLINRGLVRGLQLFIRSSRLLQHATEFVRLLERRQQKLVALGEIVRKSAVVIHNDNRSNDSFSSGKTISGIIFRGQASSVADDGAHFADQGRPAIATAVDR